MSLRSIIFLSARSVLSSMYLPLGQAYVDALDADAVRARKARSVSRVPVKRSQQLLGSTFRFGFFAFKRI